MPHRFGSIAIRAVPVGAIVVTSMLTAAGTASAGTVTAPAGTAQKPFVVPVDAKGNPQPFTITGAGWKPSSHVYVEVCDGNTPGASGWQATIDCDIGSEPAGSKVDPKGNVSFPVNQPDYALTPFRGSSPQQLFNCLSPHQADPHNGLRTFRNCQIRMTADDIVLSSEDAFLPIVLPDLSPSAAGASKSGGTSNQGAGAPAGTSSASAGNGGSSAGARPASARSHNGPLASTGARVLALVLVAAVALLLGFGAVALSRRRRAATARGRDSHNS